MNTLHRTATVVLLSLAFGVGAQPAAPVATDSKGAPSNETVLNSGLNAPLFYQLLLGELNVMAGEPGTGYSLILDAARKQKDPALYRRSVELSYCSPCDRVGRGKADGETIRVRTCGRDHGAGILSAVLCCAGANRA